MLGNMISKKIENEDYYEQLIMTTDFKGRNIIKIITQNDFEPLMDEDDPKAENLLMMIWRGKEGARCDGDILGYSNFAFLLRTKAKRATGTNSQGGPNKATLMQIITNYFHPNYSVNYSFQYKFRIQSIRFYFVKELICALLMLIIF